MSTDLMPFVYEGATVRTPIIGGEPWFVLADLCAVLDIRNARDAAARLSDDQKGVGQVDTLGGRQQMTIVNESGMYEVVIRSDKPGAVAFRRWITGEVLPAIRKTGGYSALPADYPSALEEAARQARRAIEAETKVAELAPKADAFDSFLNGEGLYLIGTVARILGVGQNLMFRFLYEQKVLISSGARKRQPYANPKFDGWFRVKTYDAENTNGRGSATTYVTPRGAEGIRLLAVEKGLIEPQLIALPSLLTKEIGA